VQGNLQGQATVSCSAGGCSVGATVRDTYVTDPRSSVVGGQVHLDMTATVTVAGQPAGGCTATTSFPARSGGSMSCFDPAAGPVFQAAYLRGIASRRPFTIISTAAVLVVGQALVNVQHLVDQLQREQSEAGGNPCGTPNSFVPGTGVLLADGTTRPIERIGVGARVLAGVPGRTGSFARTVTAVVTGEGPERLVRLVVDVDGDRGDATATLTTTAGHPFAAGARWVDAGELRVGDRLDTAAGVPVRVVATEAYRRTTRVHNLTVDGLHSFYVAAGGTAILVHNANPGAPTGCPPAPGAPTGAAPTATPPGPAPTGPPAGGASAAPRGPMRADQEQAVRNALNDVRLQPQDRNTIATRLLADRTGHGADIADQIIWGRGKIGRAPGYDVLLSSVKSPRPEDRLHALLQLRLARRLYDAGSRDLAFEAKVPIPGGRDVDMDVAIMKPGGGYDWAYQIKGKASADAAAKEDTGFAQLAGAPAGHRVLLMTVPAPRSAFTAANEATLSARAARFPGMVVRLEFSDGQELTIPPGGQVYP
jgi:hypothetical protein